MIFLILHMVDEMKKMKNRIDELEKEVKLLKQNNGQSKIAFRLPVLTN